MTRSQHVCASATPTFEPACRSPAHCCRRRYYALRARRWEFFPGTLRSVFRFSSGDHRILIDAISEDEYHAFTTMLTADDNPEKDDTKVHDNAACHKSSPAFEPAAASLASSETQSLFVFFLCGCCLQQVSYADYVRNNPETTLPRVVGCYLLQHSGLKYKEHFLVYMNPHPPPTAIKAMFVNATRRTHAPPY